MKINKEGLKKIIFENISNKHEEIKNAIAMRMTSDGNISFDDLMDISSEYGVDMESDFFLRAKQDAMSEYHNQKSDDLKYDIEYVVSQYFDDEYAPFNDFYDVFKTQNFEHSYSREEVKAAYDKITINPDQLTLDLNESEIRKIIRKTIIEEAKKSDFEKLQDNKIPLTDEEREKVMKADAIWHHGPNGAPSPAVWKSKNKKTGKITYVTHTHRAYNTAPTLKGAISRYHKFIKGTA